MVCLEAKWEPGTNRLTIRCDCGHVFRVPTRYTTFAECPCGKFENWTEMPWG